MSTEVLIEIFGYIGSAMVVISMLMVSVVKLRVINAAGSVISATYALIIGSLPLALMNICLIVINVYNLVKLLRTKNQFDVVACSGEEALVGYFLQRYQADIVKFFPEFRPEVAVGKQAYFTYCNGNPAGVLLGTFGADGVLEIHLDYSAPTYRDCSVAKYLFGRMGAYGVKTLMFSAACVPEHIAYLKRMGFEVQEGSFIKQCH